jgi:large subunit ribosomal protein L13
MKTYSVKAREIIPQWHVVDAADQPLGRLASRVASLLRGKHRPNFVPHLDMRDFVVVVNAERIRITGNNKMRQKTYYRHSMYPGGLKRTSLEKMMAIHPTRVIEHAVRGMLPHNRLGARLRRHLKVYVGPDHPHEAQLKAPQKEAPPARRKAKRETAAVAPAEARKKAATKARAAKPKEKAKPKAKPKAKAKARAKTKTKPKE